MQSFPDQMMEETQKQCSQSVEDESLKSNIDTTVEIDLTFWTPIHLAVWQMKRTSIDRRTSELPPAWGVLCCVFSKHARVASMKWCGHIVHRIVSHAIWLENFCQTSYAFLSDVHPWCRWRSHDMCGLHSEGKCNHDDYLASLQRSSRAEVERDTVVVQRIPPLYLYLRRKMRRTICSIG